MNDDFISEPHSNAFVDLNGDCMPDMLLGKTDKVGNHYFEIYTSKIHEGKQKYCLIQTGLKYVSGSNTIPLMQYFDVNQDGMMDLIFFHGKHIHVLYNKIEAKKYNVGTIDD